MDREKSFKKMRRAARKWGKETKQQMLYNISNLGLRDRGVLSNTLNVRLKNNLGEPERITFSYPLYARFVEEGVAKNSPADNRTRKKRPFAGPAINQNIGKLADVLTEIMGDEYLDNINF